MMLKKIKIWTTGLCSLVIAACSSQVGVHTLKVDSTSSLAKASLKVKVELPPSKSNSSGLLKRGFNTKFIEPTDIFFGNGQVTGNGTGGPLPADVPGNPFPLPKGSNAVDIQWLNVPIGRNRIVTVTGLDSSSAAIAPHYEIKGVSDVDVGGNNVTVSFQTTPTARVFERLITDGHPTADTADNNIVQALVDRLVSNDTGIPTDDIHPSLVDHDAIAVYMKANGGSVPNPTPPISVADRNLYTFQPGTVTGTISGLQEPYKLAAADETVFPPVTVTCNDPASQVSVIPTNVQPGLPASFNYTINNVTPGNNYTCTVQSQYHFNRNATVNVTAGGTTNQNFNFIGTDKRHWMPAAIAANGNQVWRYQSGTPIDVLLIKPSTISFPNLISWWQSEGNAADQTGTNNGTLMGTPTFAPGVSGQALSLNNAATDYVLVNPAASMPSTTFTIAFWMNTSDGRTAAPFSYAVPAQNNELLIFDPNNFRIFVDGASIATGVSANDGQWHHIVATWRNTDGQAQLYKDGILSFTGNFGVGRVINPGGAITLGQEQDCVAGCFANGQAYVGLLDEVQLYDRVLTPAEITQLSSLSAQGWNTSDHLDAAKYAIEQIKGLYGTSLTIGQVDEVFESDPNFAVTPLPAIGNSLPANPADPNSPNNLANLNTNLIGRYDLYIRWRTDFCPGTTIGRTYSTFVSNSTLTTMIELATQFCASGDVIGYDIARQVTAHELTHALAGTDHSAEPTDLLFPTVTSNAPINLNPSRNDVNTTGFLFNANPSVINTDRVP